MTMIKIEQEQNGGHDNLTIYSNVPIPEGWALVPDDMEIPSTFPFVDIEVNGQVVTSMTAGGVQPEPSDHPEQKFPDESLESVEPVATSDDILNILLGVTE